MTEADFWRLIDASRQDFDPKRRDGNMDLQEKRLETLLSALSVDDVHGFERVYRAKYGEAYRWDLWGAAYIIGGGCSDDSFMDFRAWLVSMGQAVFDAAMANPESLVEAAAMPGVESSFFEGFGYVVHRVLERKGAEEVPWRHPADPQGARWEEDDLPTLFPRLWSAFGGGAGQPNAGARRER